MIRGIKFASVPVRNQKDAVKFYTEKLGFKIITDQEFDGKQRWIELGIPGSKRRDRVVHARRPREAHRRIPAGHLLERRCFCYGERPEIARSRIRAGAEDGA